MIHQAFIITFNLLAYEVMQACPSFSHSLSVLTYQDGYKMIVIIGNWVAVTAQAIHTWLVVTLSRQITQITLVIKSFIMTLI